MEHTKSEPLERFLETICEGEVIMGDENEMMQLRRCFVNSVSIKTNLAKLVESDQFASLQLDPLLSNVLSDFVNLHRRSVVDRKRALLTELFSFGYGSISEIISRFEKEGFSFQYDIPSGAYSQNNRQSMGSYGNLYGDDITIDTMVSDLSPVPAPQSTNAPPLPERQIDMSELTKSSLATVSDKIVIGRVPVDPGKVEQYLLEHTTITQQQLDHFATLHAKLVKLVYAYKTTVLPHANLDELQHIQSLQQLLLAELCELCVPTDSMKASAWYKAPGNSTLYAHFVDAGARPVARLVASGLPDLCVYSPAPEAAPVSTISGMVEDDSDELLQLRAEVLKLEFLRRLRVILESKFAAFNTGSTRVSNKLGRSAKYQVCGYSVAVRQKNQQQNPAPFPLILSDLVSCQLLVHSPPFQGKHNLFRCLARSSDSRTFIAQHLLALHAKPRHFHDWLLACEDQLKEDRLRSESQDGLLPQRASQRLRRTAGIGQSRATGVAIGAGAQSNVQRSADLENDWSSDGAGNMDGSVCGDVVNSDVSFDEDEDEVISDYVICEFYPLIILTLRIVYLQAEEMFYEEDSGDDLPPPFWLANGFTNSAACF